MEEKKTVKGEMILIESSLEGAPEIEPTSSTQEHTDSADMQRNQISSVNHSTLSPPKTKCSSKSQQTQGQFPKLSQCQQPDRLAPIPTACDDFVSRKLKRISNRMGLYALVFTTYGILITAKIIWGILERPYYTQDTNCERRSLTEDCQTLKQKVMSLYVMELVSAVFMLSQGVFCLIMFCKLRLIKCLEYYFKFSLLMFFLFTCAKPMFYFVVLKQFKDLHEYHQLQPMAVYAFYEVNFMKNNEIAGMILTSLILLLSILCFVYTICAISLLNQQLKLHLNDLSMTSYSSEVEDHEPKPSILGEVSVKKGRAHSELTKSADSVLEQKRNKKEHRNTQKVEQNSPFYKSYMAPKMGRISEVSEVTSLLQSDKSIPSTDKLKRTSSQMDYNPGSLGNSPTFQEETFKTGSIDD